jgi:hypothetical protein
VGPPITGSPEERKEEIMEHEVTLTVVPEQRTASIRGNLHPRVAHGDRVTWKIEGAKASEVELGFENPRHPFGDFQKNAPNEIVFAVVENQPGEYKCFVLYNHGMLAWPSEGVNIPVDPPNQRR